MTEELLSEEKTRRLQRRLRRALVQRCSKMAERYNRLCDVIDDLHGQVVHIKLRLEAEKGAFNKVNGSGRNILKEAEK